MWLGWYSRDFASPNDYIETASISHSGKGLARNQNFVRSLYRFYKYAINCEPGGMNTAIPLHTTCLLLLGALCGQVRAQQPVTSSTPTKSGTSITRADDARSKVLSPQEWQRVDAAVVRALAWLATQQQPNGSFPTVERGQSGVTSLCVLAFMAHGHNPGQGEYGQRLDRATDFIIQCQKENGLITLLGPEGPRITSDVINEIGEAAVYNHAISSLALSEMYGIGQSKRSAQLAKVIKKSLAATLEMQRWPKALQVDRGGWRYVTKDPPNDSDLSITGWQLMFLRSARNAGFDVPRQSIDDAIAYVRRTFNKRFNTFGYVAAPNTLHSRAMAGAGILALAHAGYHNSAEAQQAGKWMLEHNFNDYNGDNGLLIDRYHYSLFNACQAMYQLGDPYWEKFFPRTAAVVLASQRPNGSWDAERVERDRPFGNSYTTALVVLSLGASNQFLPVFQR
jgi:hypothetical protein